MSVIDEWEEGDIVTVVTANGSLLKRPPVKTIALIGLYCCTEYKI